MRPALAGTTADGGAVAAASRAREGTSRLLDFFYERETDERSIFQGSFHSSPYSFFYSERQALPFLLLRSVIS
jgi:hypothetical protein